MLEKSITRIFHEFRFYRRLPPLSDKLVALWYFSPLIIAISCTRLKLCRKRRRVVVMLSRKVLFGMFSSIKNDAVIRIQQNKKDAGDIYCHPVYVPLTQCVAISNSARIIVFILRHTHVVLKNIFQQYLDSSIDIIYIYNYNLLYSLFTGISSHQ